MLIPLAVCDCVQAKISRLEYAKESLLYKGDVKWGCINSPFFLLEKMTFVNTG